MSLWSLLLITGSAALHSGWNVTLKKQSDTSASAIALAALACLMALGAGLPYFTTALSSNTIPYTMGAGIFAGGALATIGLAFRGGSLGLTYTVSRAGSILFLWPLSYYLLGEEITLTAALGAVILTAGLAIIMLRGKKEKTSKHLWWAFLSCLCIVGYHLCYKKAIMGGANTFALLGLSDVLRVLVAFLLLDSQRIIRMKKVFQKDWRPILTMAVMSFGSFSIFLYALKFEGAAHLGTLRNLSILFTAFGASKLGETLSRHSLLLIILSLAGTILIGMK